MIYAAYYESPLRRITIVEENEHLVGLWFEGQCTMQEFQNGREVIWKQTPLLARTQDWLNHYFLGEAPKMDLPLHTNGTVFQEQVWKILRKIPYGMTMSYQKVGELVRKSTGQKRMSAQAVGQAVGKNPISILIPCHRVLGKDGSLTGYAGGVDLKEALLKMELSI